MKIYESVRQVIYRGLDDEAKSAAKAASANKDKIICLYATEKEFSKNLDFLNELELSNYVALYSYKSKIEDSFIINRHAELEKNTAGKKYEIIAGSHKGKIYENK